MFPRRKASALLLNEPAPKRLRTTSGRGGLSSSVVIEQLDKRDKRRKAPVGRRYVPGMSKAGPLIPVSKRAENIRTPPASTSFAVPNTEFTPVFSDDFANIVFEDVFPPQRRRQVESHYILVYSVAYKKRRVVHR